MKYRLLFAFILLGFYPKAQPCKLFTQTFAVADTIKRETGKLYRFRFSDTQLNALKSLPDMEKPVDAVSKLQKTLNEDNDSYEKGVFWQLDTKLAVKQFEELKKECPETGFRVFEKEIEFYKSKFKAKSDVK
jgi:hypothetical protein